MTRNEENIPNDQFSLDFEAIDSVPMHFLGHFFPILAKKVATSSR